MEGGSHNAPFNPYTYVRIEVDGLYVSLNHPNVHGTCVAWGIKGRSLSPKVAVRLRIALRCASRQPIFWDP